MSNSRPTATERQQVVEYIESLEKQMSRLEAENQKLKDGIDCEHLLKPCFCGKWARREGGK